MANELYPSWLNDRFKSFTTEWSDWLRRLKSDYSFDFDYLLKEFLDLLDVSYTLDRHTGYLTIQISPGVVIEGEFQDAEYAFAEYEFYVLSRWEGKEFKKQIFGCSIFFIKHNPRFLLEMVEDAKNMAEEMTLQMKSHRQGDVLSSVVDSYLDEIGAKNISLTVISRECCRLSTPLFSDVAMAVDVTLDDYIQKINLLTSALKREFPASINKLKCDTVSVYSLRGHYKRGGRTLPVWKGEPKQIRYESLKVLAMTNTATAKEVGNRALYTTLCDCGYKFCTNNYLYDGLQVILSESTRLLFREKHCYLMHNNAVIDEGYDLHTTNFISILQIVASLPPVSFKVFDECSTTKEFIYKLFGEEVRKFLLPNYCSYYGYTNVDIFVFSDKSTVEKMDRSDNLLGICVKPDKNYISNYMSVLTNADLFYEIFVSSSPVKACLLEKIII